jgi:prolyl-tRNA synthetase
MAKIADQNADFPQWYLDVIAAADLAEHAEVRGCIIFKPYGYALWEAIQSELNSRIKALGVDNVYFPLFIPESMITKEKDHVEGFAPECAVVTHGGGKELTEKLYVRPTSETVVYAAFSRWIQSHRDLPMKINQWANVVRWEMRPRAFLRTLEFLWQEGHTAHATREDAETMVKDALKMYVDFDRDFLALPVVQGKKPLHETFAGAEYTLSTEALAKDGKAIQAGTSHYIGNTFATAYGVKFVDTDSKQKPVHTTSWGLSTRIIGTMIVVHGDEKGLRIPPMIAPIQMVIVPIYKTDEERDAVMAKAREIHDAMTAGGVRVKFDDRTEKSPGFKFNEWEVKGVPLRLELGPKDLAQKQVTLARRDTSEKSPVAFKDFDLPYVQKMLMDIQSNMLAQAEKYMEEHTHNADSYDELKKIIGGDGGFVWAPWDGTLETANKIKDETKATIRLLGDASKAKGKKDVLSGKPATEMALYAKAY